MTKPSEPLSQRAFLGRIAVAGSAVSLILPIGAAEAKVPSGGQFNPRDFGARGDGGHLDTAALQAAIDACAAAGGGTVVVPAGRFLTGTLFLKSHVALHLAPGAVLLGSPALEHYPPTRCQVRSYTDNYTERSLIYGEGLEQVTLEGRGQIDGQGSAFKGPYKVRPYLIRLISCRDVVVKDVTLRDSPMWVQHYLACENVRIDGITVRSQCNANNDGIDIDGCERVRIAHCDIRSGDDAIVLKSTLDRICRDVVITNCILSSDCNAFKLGTESNGGFEDIALSNCTIQDTRLAGIAIEMVDGGRLERVAVSNVTMRDVACPVFVRLGNRARPFRGDGPKPGRGRLRNVRLSHITATGANAVGCSVTGLPDSLAEDIRLESVRITFAGGGKAGDAEREIPEVAERYPEYQMFGTLPAYGFYCRHVRGLELRGLKLDFGKEDLRPALICDDVEDLELAELQAGIAPDKGPVVRLNDVRDAFIHGCKAPRGAAAFLQVRGKASKDIHLAANQLRGARQAVDIAAGLDRSVVRMTE